MMLTRVIRGEPIKIKDRYVYTVWHSKIKMVHRRDCTDAYTVSQQY